MSYKVEVDFAPVYECIASLTAFASKQNHHAMDEGKLWVREVQGHFAPIVLQKMRSSMKKLEDFSLSPYVWNCPGERSVPEFLDWLDGLSTGQLYDISASCGQSVPSNLPELRSLALEVLREWDTHYFSGINPDIITGLAQAAASLRASLDESNGMDVCEKATGGMRFYPDGALKRIVLVPQYHARPLVTSSIYDEIIFSHYPCDAIPPAPGHPAPGLLRLTRALSDETRLCILRLLSRSQMTFTEIVKEIGLSKSTIHYHLIALRAAGLVIIHYRSVKNVEYSLRLEALNGLPSQIGDFLKG
ncbi:winged helix-turn-helix domain-containing protein [Paenibacillus sp. M1]|uniref:Winged helix-turn-helix domain-containing protein n=1 Tax=Paenibacillus haidiansis TaxID=1574488 RepID=A0ABU7VX46_9BACL